MTWGAKDPMDRLEEFVGTTLLEPSTVEVFEDRELPDLVVDTIEKGCNVLLEAEDDDFTLEGEESIYTVRLMTDLITIHDYVSKFQSGDLRMISEEHYKRSRLSSYFGISKVGKVTGDLLVTITGKNWSVTKNLQKFLDIDCHRPSFRLCVLLLRSVLMGLPEEFHNGLKVTKVTSSLYPHFLVPGYLVTFESDDQNSVVDLVKRTSYSGPTTGVINTYNYPSNEVPIIEDLRTIDLSSKASESKTHDTRAKKVQTDDSQKITYRLVQFTRKEVTYLIGKHGKKIEEFRKRSKASIKVVPLNSEMNDHLINGKNKVLVQFLRISGTKKQIQDAFTMIESDIYQFRQNGITKY